MILKIDTEKFTVDIGGSMDIKSATRFIVDHLKGKQWILTVDAEKFHPKTARKEIDEVISTTK